MKATTWAAMAVLAALILPAAAMGQTAATQPKPKAQTRPQPKLPTGYVVTPAGWGTYEEFFKACELDSHQLYKIADIEAQRAAAVKDKEKAFQAAQQAFMKAWASKDSDAIAKTQAEYMEAWGVINQAATKAQAETMAVLTDRQRAQWQEYVALKSVKASFAGVDFSDAQWDKIMDAYEKLARDSSVQPASLLSTLMAKVNDLLTPQQKAKRVMATRYAMMDKVCHFTPEQVAKLVKIEDDRTKAMADLQESIAPRAAQLGAAMQAAYASGDHEAAAAIGQQYGELYKPYGDLNKQFEDKVQAVMTDTQKSVWQEQLDKWKVGMQVGGTGVGAGGGAATSAPSSRK